LTDTVDFAVDQQGEEVDVGRRRAVTPSTGLADGEDARWWPGCSYPRTASRTQIGRQATQQARMSSATGQ
jgi:hypothetical protein